MLEKQNKTINENGEPSIYWFRNELNSTEHLTVHANILKIRNHLLRQHSVLDRVKNAFAFKGKQFIPATIILQSMKTVLNFHVAYLVGSNPSYTGNPHAVEVFSKIYRRGLYSKTDWDILYNLVTYGNAYEYVYKDVDGKIKSKVFRNTDAYPIYDGNNQYRYFVEYWKDNNEKEHYTIYYPTHVDTYIGTDLIDSSINLTGLPIHYVAMERDLYDNYGYALPNDLIPIMDKIENLISKIDDAVTTLSLNPIGVIQGQKVTENDCINSNVAGAILNVDEGQDFKWANSEMDYEMIKYELDQLYQQFNMCACIPSSIIGQSNIANVSENTTSLIFQMTENKGKQNINSLLEGFYKRWDAMRKLLVEPLTDEEYETLNCTFNFTRPIDRVNDIENMVKQFSIGALSKRTFIEQSPYVSDLSQEISRLEAEGNSIYSDSAEEAEEPQAEERQAEDNE